MYFNPRTREGCDAPTTFKQYCTRSISIHAPVKGATGYFMYAKRIRCKFQSTHP